MIHSMSGGVLGENPILTFAKVEAEGSLFWYLAPEGIAEGARVEVPLGTRRAEGVVVKVERCDRQTAPFPVNRLKEIERIL